MDNRSGDPLAFAPGERVPARKSPTEAPADGPLPGDPYRAALDLAFGYLAPRARSRAEVRQRLLRAGFRPETADEVDARLAELGLLDDRALAREVAERADARREGPEALRRALAARGVPDGVATEALAGLPRDPREEAFALAEERVRTLGKLPPASRVRRLAAFLVRRGYAQDLVEEVCRRLLGPEVD